MIQEDQMKALYKAGLIGAKPFYYYELANKVQQLEATGVKHSLAIQTVAYAGKINMRTVYRAVKAWKAIKLS